MSTPTPSTPSSPQQPGQIDPTTPPSQSMPAELGASANSTSFEDPTGVWSRFLGGPSGTPASPQEVNMFLSTLLKFFSKVILTQSDEAAKRSSQKMKDAIEGRDD